MPGLLPISQYPYRHSTYFTGRDPIHTSELPPMNSTEDILQDIFMRDRNAIYFSEPTTRRTGFKKVLHYLKDWKQDIDNRLVSFPRSLRRAF
ncbi:hypothetical protein D9613_011124 [Agrocybe pediades]|uniref:Uncharacterized protein n=1 Tax=Agrocybe pediades TaxID=84607 RepID=A0A8H4VME2_9AGAR|nr:hypothetical protein D9613_011124 [Agrocybe pediades]KAF9564063.1 hypothetical protein CPC08DRAFT_760452 [Agrocybe pediades]